MKWNEVQRDFSGGEISQRMLMRDDLEAHQKAVLTMENYIPTLQGTALRAPGSRFLWEITDADGDSPSEARIIPYLTPNNNYAIVEILPLRALGAGEIRIRQDIQNVIDGLPTDGGYDPDASQSVFKRIKDNDSFDRGAVDWEFIDEQYSGGNGDQLGWWQNAPGIYTAVTRVGRFPNKDNPTATLKGECVVPETTDQLQIAPIFTYRDNFSDISLATHTGKISVGTTEGGDEIWSYDFSEMEVSDVYDQIISLGPADLPGGQILADTTLYLTFTFTATVSDDINQSTPYFTIQQFRLLSKVTVDVNSQTPTLNVPVNYTPQELRDLQYIQSPYSGSGIADGSFGNELVLVHPNHYPKRLYYSNGSYIFEDIPFQFEPDVWGPEKYPACCSAYLGRLVLAGSNKGEILGDLNGSPSQTVWMTEVNRWFTFTDPAAELDPDSSIEFASTYRSPIQWVHGQSNLLVGSESFEYVSNADGIYSPGDLGVFLQSTHGSERVQPVPMGQYVLFAAEQGSRVRAMQYLAESEYWVSPDMTLFHPDLFARNGGIKRMGRMRNPHQMCVCVMGNGQLALLHQDSYANISGWSRLNLGIGVLDICVQPQEDGSDVLYMLTRHVVNGVKKMYLEAIADWTYAEENNWGYTRSSVNFLPTTAGNVITGLDHLEGKIVQVVSERSYIGSYTVESGQITLTDGTGAPINVSSAEVGMQQQCVLRTMPLVTESPEAKKRYSSIHVRCRNSSRPVINNSRVPDRLPSTFLDQAEPLGEINDYEIENLGPDRLQIIEVREFLPVRVEVVGIFGTVKGNSIS